MNRTYKITGTVKHVLYAARNERTRYGKALPIPDFYVDATSQTEAILVAKDIMLLGNAYGHANTIFALTATEIDLKGDSES
jgi:hypothetical protein